MKQRILIVTALWQRPEISGVVLAYYAELAKRDNMNLQLLCVGSDESARDLAATHGWNYCHFENKPLTQKMNALYQAAQSFDFDLMVLVGSDDLLGAEILSFYDKNVTRHTPDLVGLSDIYFYSIAEERTLYFPGYGTPSPKTIGAGRCFSRHILERLNFRPWKGERMDRGMDSISSANMKRIGIKEVAYTMKQAGGLCVDIKGDVNLTVFTNLTVRGIYTDDDAVIAAFPDQMRVFKSLRKEATV